MAKKSPNIIDTIEKEIADERDASVRMIRACAAYLAPADANLVNSHVEKVAELSEKLGRLWENQNE